MNANTIVITGANRGIGLAIARIYRGRGDRVVALCRRASDALRDCGAEIIDDVDVTSTGALQRAAAAVENLDVLIANAGVLSKESFASVADARDRIERQFTVNALGPLHSARIREHSILVCNGFGQLSFFKGHSLERLCLPGPAETDPPSTFGYRIGGQGRNRRESLINCFHAAFFVRKVLVTPKATPARVFRRCTTDSFRASPAGFAQPNCTRSASSPSERRAPLPAARGASWSMLI